MDARFTSAWARIDAKRHAGESFDEILRRAPTPDLIAALAGAASEDPAAANAIATHLLNRHRRAPFLGASLVSFTTLLVIYATDLALHGEPFHLMTGPVANVVAIMSLAIAIVSALSFALWRGRLPRIRAVFARDRRY